MLVARRRKPEARGPDRPSRRQDVVRPVDALVIAPIFALVLGPGRIVPYVGGGLDLAQVPVDPEAVQIAQARRRLVVAAVRRPRWLVALGSPRVALVELAQRPLHELRQGGELRPNQVVAHVREDGGRIAVRHARLQVGFGVVGRRAVAVEEDLLTAVHAAPGEREAAGVMVTAEPVGPINLYPGHPDYIPPTSSVPAVAYDSLPKATFTAPEITGLPTYAEGDAKGLLYLRKRRRAGG